MVFGLGSRVWPGAQLRHQRRSDGEFFESRREGLEVGPNSAHPHRLVTYVYSFNLPSCSCLLLSGSSSHKKRNETQSHPTQQQGCVICTGEGGGFRKASVVLRGESRHLASVLCLSQRRRLYLTILFAVYFAQGDMFVSVANHGVRPRKDASSFTLLQVS